MSGCGFWWQIWMIWGFDLALCLGAGHYTVLPVKPFSENFMFWLEMRRTSLTANMVTW